MAEPRTATSVQSANWYYAHNGQQAGPVPQAELESLARQGLVTPGTLVWREGMSEWQPYNTLLRPTPPLDVAALTAAPPVINQGQCVECHRFYAKDDLLRYESVLVCATCKPGFFQKLREGVATGTAGGLWRSGQLLVMRKQSLLPDRCVKCNKPANGFRLKRNLSWHSPWLFLLLLAAWLIYLIVAALTSKKARIEIGLCDDHRRIRYRNALIAWSIFIMSLGSFAAATFLNPGWPFALAGLGLLLAAIIYGVALVPMVQPKRIDDEFVWLNGVSKEYLADLPEFTARN